MLGGLEFAEEHFVVRLFRRIQPVSIKWLRNKGYHLILPRFRVPCGETYVLLEIRARQL